VTPRAQTAPPKAPTPDRRRPQQERSRATVDAILDAADALVASEGTAGLTTTGVARGADIAVGTLYQYFEGVPAILEALVGRHADRFADRLGHELAGRRLRKKREGANAALDALIAYYRAEPGFRVLWREEPQLVHASFGSGGGGAVKTVGTITSALVAQDLLREGDQHFALEAEIQFAVAVPLIELAFRRDADGDPVVLAHLRRLWDLDVRTA
jgi:AcrR family transcriptional regulator